MQQVLIFHTGETTCSSGVGNDDKGMCPFAFAKAFGTQPVCHLYWDRPLYEEEGWLMRHEECKHDFRGSAVLTASYTMERP